MKSICFFSSYFTQSEIPFYVKKQVEELKIHFEKIIFITNKKTLNPNETSYLNDLNVQLMLVENEGFDFGMWYKAFQEIDVSMYQQLALINDSCILFKPLTETMNWVNKANFDFSGLVSSNRFDFHIQSFFLVINGKAIAETKKYFLETGLVTDYMNVIEKYELGLSKHLQQKGFSAGAMYESITLNSIYNPSFYKLTELIAAGIPMIKKKIIFRNYRKFEYVGLFKMKFDIDEKKYIQLIASNSSTERILDLNKLAINKKRSDIILYNITLSVVSLLRKSTFLLILYRSIVNVRRKLKANKK